MSWDEAERWYSSCVGEKGHYYHQAFLLSHAIRLLSLKKGDSLLDVGCGQGVLARHLSLGIEYWGIDSSQKLIQRAKKMTRRAATHFLSADATAFLLDKRDFHAALFLLSLQNMECPDRAVAQAALHLRTGGKLLLVLNHPCFRIPRQSGWGIDEQAKCQYRRINLYMGIQKIPIQTSPSRKEFSEVTYSYHYPLSSFISFLVRAGLSIIGLEEWCSDKKSEGKRAKMEDRARREFPLFLAILAQKELPQIQS